MNVVLAKPSHRQRVEDMGGNAEKNVELRECKQRGTSACLHDFQERRVCRAIEMAYCSIVRELNLVA